MQADRSGVKTFQNKNNIIWQIFFLLIVLSTVMTALAMSCLHSFVFHSDCEISLYKTPVFSGWNKAGTVGTTFVRSRISDLSEETKKAFDIRTFDNKNVWSTNTPIELFHTDYRNRDGEITVQNRESENLVAPGTEGSYTFSLRNAGRWDSNYRLWIEKDAGSSEIPLEFRMSGRDGWVSGNEKWLSAEELGKIKERKKLRSGESTQYTLYWRWVFERGADEEDTFYGNLAARQRNIAAEDADFSPSALHYKVTLHTFAEQEMLEDKSAGASSAVSRTDAAQKKAVKTGDSTQVTSWMLILRMAGAVIEISRRHRKERTTK